MTEPHHPPPAAPGPGAGPIAELIRALADLGLRPDSRELAGALWLALRIDRVTPGWSTLDADGAPPLPAARTPSLGELDDPPAASGDGTDGTDSRPPDRHAADSPEPERAAGIPAFPLTARAAAGAIAASAVSVPERSYLPQALHLGRAWRMLRRRRPSRSECALDLEATVERFVEQRLHRQGLWGLVYRARSVPWLDLTLVIDRGPAMAVWEPQVRELTALLRRTGAFGTVRIRHLESATAGPCLLEAGRPVPAAALGQPLPGAAPGHMLTLVLSDGISRAWYDPATYRLLHRLGRDGLAVLVQLLPANRWIDTALGAGVEVRLGVARTRDPKLPVIASLAGDADALPVISQTPWGVRTLVELLRGGGPAAGLIGYRLEGPGVALGAASPYGTDPPPAERLERFLSVASPAARRLAGYLSRLPYPLTVRMMLLVQRAMQPGEDLSALAEVFSGGLLELHRPAGPGHPKSYRLVGQGTDRPDPGPVVRALANLVSRDEAWTVLCTLTSALRRSGQHPAADWPLLIEDAAAGAPFRLPAGLLDGDAWERALALIAVDVARRRGGVWLRGGKRLAQALAEPLPEPTPRVPDPVPTPPTPTAPTPFRDPFTDGSGDAPEMIWLPGGTFHMGSPAGVGADDERPDHEVSLSHHAVGKYPVTVGEFRRFCAATGYRTEAELGGGASVRDKGKWGTKKDASWENPYFAQDDHHPVVCISWQDAQAYCDWLSGATGQIYGLLSEAQWEHACRAGRDTRYCFGDDEGQLGDYAWYHRNADNGTHPVGAKRGNAWGLHDLHGNVWEWCRDWYSRDYYQPFVGSAARTDAPEVSAAPGPHSGPYGDAQSTRTAASGVAVAASSGEQPLATDPSGPETGSGRVMRGGSWSTPAGHCRSAYRSRFAPSSRISNLGFRLSRTGPWHSYPLTLVGAQISAPPEPPVPAARPSFAPYEVFRDPLESAGQDGAAQQVLAAPEMVYLPGGIFQMGDEQGSSDEQPVHPVRLDAFALGRTPVTWGEYLRFCEATGKHWPKWLELGNEYHVETGKDHHYTMIGVGREALDLPVVGISWDDADAYCAWLSEQTGERYALPTEAQWEYACRGGTATRWCSGNQPAGLGDYAWFRENAAGRLHPVGQKQANAWGLHDMHGNVWEWCADWYAADYYKQPTGARAAAASRSERAASGGQQRASGWQRIAKAFGFGAGDAAADASGNPAAAGGVQQSASENPSGPKTDSSRVIRGGAWSYPADNCRAAYRYGNAPSERLNHLGFRLSRTV